VETLEVLLSEVFSTPLQLRAGLVAKLAYPLKQRPEALVCSFCHDGSLSHESSASIAVSPDTLLSDATERRQQEVAAAVVERQAEAFPR
jgi:hypothetical protein